MALSAKQQAFVEHYCTTWNGAEAARLAGYSEKTAREQASRLLTNVNVQAAIQERLAELKMSADEVLTRLADQARGSVASSVTIRTVEGDAPIRTEVYDAQAALALLGKHHKLFTDKTEQSGNLTITVLHDDDSAPSEATT